MSITNVVVYHINEDNVAGSAELQALPAPAQAAVVKFLVAQNQQNVVQGPYGTYQDEQWKVHAVFTEAVDRKSKRLPILEQAIVACGKVAGVLVIPELKDLVRNEALTMRLITSKLRFYCLDQPSITKDTLPALAETFSQLRMRHSQRIRQALQQTVAKLGNPNALKEITKVNKPKKENAVMFALLLAPIIDHYRQQGFSQRKIVDTLNHEGFLAPEGGQWVLSQLQKVLERIEHNRCALNLGPTLAEFAGKGYNLEQQIKALTAMQIKTPTRKPWDLELLQELIERKQMVDEVLTFNDFIIEVLPKIIKYQEQGLSDEAIADKLNAEQVQIPQRVLWELQQEVNDDAVSEQVQGERWEAEGIELACAVARRRQEDMQHLFKAETLAKSQELLE